MRKGDGALAQALYSSCLYLAAPLLLGLLALRSIATPQYRRRWRERFGIFPPIRQRPVWVHCASVGEFQAALPLLRSLATADVPILITTFTATGSARVVAEYGERVVHVYVPFDLRGAVRRFLDRANPRVALIMETELWPNLFNQCHRRGIPVILVNARLSPRSFRFYRRLAPLVGRTLKAAQAIAARSEEDAARLIALGAERGRVSVVGDIKFDLEVDAQTLEAAQRLRLKWGQRLIWIAASTHAGEDEQVLDAFAEVRRSVPDAVLMLAPRHPERFARVAALVRDRGYRAARRSVEKAPRADTEVFIGDTLGELCLFYAAADVAFVGGSLVPVGGHNPLEAAAVGLPVIVGPHTFNFHEVTAALAQANVLRVVANSVQLAAVVRDYLEDATDRLGVGENARQAVARNRGALRRIWAMLDPYLD